MKLLALDTSTETCSVALRIGDDVRVRRHAGAREQTAHVLPMVQSLLAEAGVALQTLDAIACAHGPGAFTGVRVAVSVVQGLAYAARVPAIGISTLAALAQQAVRLQDITHERGAGAASVAVPVHVLPVLDARMGELYAGAYVTDASGLVAPLQPDVLLRPDAFVAAVPAVHGGVRWLAIGSGWPLLTAQTGGVNVDASAAIRAEPDAIDVLSLAARALAHGDVLLPEQLLPVYLRDTVAWKKLAEQGKP